MNKQAIANMVEGLAELHVEHLKTGAGASLIDLSIQKGKRA